LLRKALKVRSHILLLLLVKCERKEINWGGKKKKNRSRILFFKKTKQKKPLITQLAEDVSVKKLTASPGSDSSERSKGIKSHTKLLKEIKGMTHKCSQSNWRVCRLLSSHYPQKPKMEI
jgi:hypothetical protein